MFIRTTIPGTQGRYYLNGARKRETMGRQKEGVLPIKIVRTKVCVRGVNEEVSSGKELIDGKGGFLFGSGEKG